MRLLLSQKEALYVLWALEEALSFSEPEEEELLFSLISRISSYQSSAPFSSASDARAYSLSSSPIASSSAWGGASSSSSS